MSYAQLPKGLFCVEESNCLVILSIYCFVLRAQPRYELLFPNNYYNPKNWDVYNTYPLYHPLITIIYRHIYTYIYIGITRMYILSPVGYNGPAERLEQ